jgi:hypothetical protein
VAQGLVICSIDSRNCIPAYVVRKPEADDFSPLGNLICELTVVF